MVNCFIFFLLLFLAHLSQSLIGKLMGYPWSGVRHRRPSTFSNVFSFETAWPIDACSGFRPSVRRPSTISNIFSSETTWPIKAKFYVERPWEGGRKVYINSPGRMTKMAAMPKYGINLKKNLLQNQMSYDLETWHVAFGTQALQSLYK